MASYHRVFSSFFVLRLDFRRSSGGLAVNPLSMVELLLKAQIWYCCQGEQNQNDELASQASNCKGVRLEKCGGGRTGTTASLIRRPFAFWLKQR